MGRLVMIRYLIVSSVGRESILQTRAPPLARVVRRAHTSRQKATTNLATAYCAKQASTPDLHIDPPAYENVCVCLYSHPSAHVLTRTHMRRRCAVVMFTFPAHSWQSANAMFAVSFPLPRATVVSLAQMCYCRHAVT